MLRDVFVRIKDREAKLRARRERMPKHGRNLADLYRRAVERRAKAGTPSDGPAAGSERRPRA